MLVQVQTCTTTLEIIMIAYQKIGNQSTAQTSNITLGHIPKGCVVSHTTKIHLLNHIHNIIVIARTWKQPGCSSTKERICGTLAKWSTTQQ